MLSIKVFYGEYSNITLSRTIVHKNYIVQIMIHKNCTALNSQNSYEGYIINRSDNSTIKETIKFCHLPKTKWRAMTNQPFNLPFE